jgi:hypothetical protein
MGEMLKRATIGNLWFKVLSGFAMILIVAGFIVPPMGIIDGSVLTAVGEIFAFAAVNTALKAMDQGFSARVRHKKTTLSLDKSKDNAQNAKPPKQPKP